MTTPQMDWLDDQRRKRAVSSDDLSEITPVDDDIVKAEVRPLDGKHYGTTVALTIGKRVFDINVWIPLGVPSEADLQSWGITPQQWIENVEVDNGWGGTEPIQQMHPCDGHYQSEVEKVVAEHIAYALNVLPITIPVEARRG